jgi:uncharacterized protein (TIGR03086 family)
VEVIDVDLLDLYRRGSEWTLARIEGAADQLDAPTPCEEWDVRKLLDHMLETQRYFAAAGRGDEDATPPSPEPPELISDDPVADFADVRSQILDAYGQDGAVDKTGPLLGIAFTDQLLHGWDLARATGQESEMPDGLAAAAYRAIHGRFTDEQRKGVFGPEIVVADDAPPQARLLAYTGRDPG